MRSKLIVLTTLLIGAVLAAMQPNSSAHYQGSDPQATINALQTQVSELQTQIASNQPAPTSTAAPVPTVSTEPTPLADGLEILYYYKVEGGSSTKILGEVRNTTDQQLDSPYFKITLLDADGNIVGTTSASSALVTVGAGESIPFDASVYDVDTAEWQHEEINACDWPSDFYVNEGYGESPLLLLEEVSEVQKSADRLEVEGKVRNNGDVPISQVQIKAFVYLPDGRYAGNATARIDVPIPAGKTARFKINGSGYELPGLDLLESGDTYTYRMWVGTQPNATVHFC